MPGFDGTGPEGLGPMTGGGRGFCAMHLGNRRPFLGGRGWGGRNRGRGRGWRWGWSKAPQEETTMLKEEAQILKQQLNDIQERISILEKNEKR